MIQSTKASISLQSSGLYVRRITGEMPEVVVLFEHWRFVDLIVGGNVSSVSIFCQLLDIFGIIPADANIEEYDVAVDILFAHDVFQVVPRWPADADLSSSVDHGLRRQCEI
jgi:hypothetical protein